MSPLERKKQLPIGIFDSGLGGLTVVHAVRKALPSERVVYLGDNARVPYGTRSPQTVVRYAESCAAFLQTMGFKMLVVACNTVSSVAMPALRRQVNGPVLGVIEAGAAAITAHRPKRIGVIGTAGTIRSEAYIREIHRLNPDCEVHQQPAPLFVPLAEEGWLEGEVPLLAAKRYLKPLTSKDIDVLLLGCTHYPLLRRSIERALKELGSGALIVDSATAMARSVEEVLREHDLQNDGAGLANLDVYVTDMPESFHAAASRFLNEDIDGVTCVDI